MGNCECVRFRSFCERGSCSPPEKESVDNDTFHPKILNDRELKQSRLQLIYYPTSVALNGLNPGQPAPNVMSLISAGRVGGGIKGCAVFRGITLKRHYADWDRLEKVNRKGRVAPLRSFEGL